MMLDVGNKVVYPSYGPCRIGAVVIKEIGGRRTSFYPLAVMDDSGNVLFVPVDKVNTLGIRRLMEKSEVLKLLSQLNRGTQTAIQPTKAMNWKQRAIDNSALLASGSAFDLAKLIGSLTEMNETKALSPRDRQVLDKARNNLICEISEVTGESGSVAEEQLDDALNIKKGRVGNSERYDLESNGSPVNFRMKKHTA